MNYSIPFRQEAPLGRVLTVFASDENYDAYGGSSVVHTIGSFFRTCARHHEFPPGFLSFTCISSGQTLDATCCTTGGTVGQSRYARSVGSIGAVTGARHARTLGTPRA